MLTIFEQTTPEHEIPHTHDRQPVGLRLGLASPASRAMATVLAARLETMGQVVAPRSSKLGVGSDVAIVTGQQGAA